MKDDEYPLTRRKSGENDGAPPTTRGESSSPQATTLSLTGESSSKRYRPDHFRFIRYIFVLACVGLVVLGIPQFRQPLIPLFFLDSAPPVVADAGIIFEGDPDDRKLTECGIWVAPSSLRPYPGFGIFTTRDIQARESILHSPDGVTIQMREMKRRTGMPFQQARRRMWKTWSAYMWHLGVPDHDRYFWPQDTVDVQPGFGALPNHHCILRALTFDYAEVPYNDVLVNRSTSPGVGAFTYTLGRDFRATRALKAGDEIFLNYGMCERNPEGKYDFDWGEFIYMVDDFIEAARIVKMYEPFGPLPWPENNFTLANGLDLAGNANPVFVGEILPHTKEARERLFAAVNQYAFDENAANKELLRELARGTLVQRTPTWVKQNGICLEHLVPKESTLPDAGFGGFAQFGVKKGEIIVPAPVFHVTNKEAMGIYQAGVNALEDPDRYRIGTQVILNYCFGHPESSMLMCPMTSAVLINHCSTRTMGCGPDGPNAVVRWSSGWDPSSVAWRSKTFEEIDDHRGRILSFEVVATRDISPGEEVFLDYGVEWENAWNNHVQQWVPPKMESDFISAREANERPGPVVESLVSGNLRSEVNHSYLFTGCIYKMGEIDMMGESYTKPNPKWAEMTDDEIINMYATSGEKFYRDSSYVHHQSRSHWPCTVLLPESEDGEYTVRIHMTPMTGTISGREIVPTAWYENDVPRILTNYPQSSIHYFVKPSATDHMLPGVFRHPIGFPDELFPKQWRKIHTE